MKILKFNEKLSPFLINLASIIFRAFLLFADKIYELRIKLGSDICRLFYFHWKGTIYVITSGYMKKTDKLDKREIEKAEKIKKIFKD